MPDEQYLQKKLTGYKKELPLLMAKTIAVWLVGVSSLIVFALHPNGWLFFLLFLGVFVLSKAIDLGRDVNHQINMIGVYENIYFGSYRYLGDKKTGAYHNCSQICGEVGAMNPRHRRWFKDVETAQKEGYLYCSSCEQDRAESQYNKMKELFSKTSRNIQGLINMEFETLEPIDHNRFVIYMVSEELNRLEDLKSIEQPIIINALMELKSNFDILADRCNKILANVEEMLSEMNENTLPLKRLASLRNLSDEAKAAYKKVSELFAAIDKSGLRLGYDELREKLTAYQNANPSIVKNKGNRLFEKEAMLLPDYFIRR